VRKSYVLKKINRPVEGEVQVREEVVIIPAERKWIFDGENNFTNRMLGKEMFDPHVNLRREPDYVAIMINDENSVQVIAEVDYGRSDLKSRELWVKNAIKVMIPIRFGKATKHKYTLQGVKYTTFRKLLTHKTTSYL
jgi:hypothetical protein